MRRVVVRPPNWLGDAVLSLPALAAVRRHFAEDQLTIAAVPGVAGLFREDSGVRPDRVMDLPARSAEAVAALVSGDFDLGVLFPNSFRSAWQLKRARVQERWGFSTSSRGFLLTRRSTWSARGSKPVHQADYYRALVRGLGIECDDHAPCLRPSESSVARARAVLDQQGLTAGATLVAVAPGAAYGQAKQWPPDRVAEAIARIARERGASVVLVGAMHDRPAAREIESWLRAHAPELLPHVVDLVGRTSLGVLAGVLAACRTCITNDSGAMHLAAAVGCPVVATFGPTDERATGPIGVHHVLTAPVFCRPCHLRDCPIDHRCMKRITVDAVTAAAISDVDRQSA